MQDDLPEAMDPRQLGSRLREARNARGLTQQEVAASLGVARTTLTAMEQGERRVRPSELLHLAGLFGRGVSELVRSGQPTESFAVQLRGNLPSQSSIGDLSSHIWEFQRLCEDYVEIERITNSPIFRTYPPTYEIGGLSAEIAADDVAWAERNRLGLGDGPVLNLRELLEVDVGLRIFYLGLPSKVAGMFAYTRDLGGCIAINRSHPAERRRHSLVHDYGHFLASRFRSTVTLIQGYERRPKEERFAETFARAFLLPATGLRRRYHEVVRQRGKATPADLCRLAHFYFVSLEVMTRRLEELRLVPMGTWDRLSQAGFKVREAQSLLGLKEHSEEEALFPPRYLYLAAEALADEQISEGQFARFLRVDRLQARRLVKELERSGLVDGTGGGFAERISFPRKRVA